MAKEGIACISGAIALQDLGLKVAAPRAPIMNLSINNCQVVIVPFLTGLQPLWDSAVICIC